MDIAQSKKTLNLKKGKKNPGNLGHYENVKPVNKKYRGRRKTEVKGSENIVIKIIEQNFPNLKKEVSYQGTRSLQNTK